MKYLLSLILLIPSISFADQQTTGNMKLLLPTTGQAFDPNDPTKRPWGAKINENFKIIDSTLTNVQSSLSGIANSTNTLFQQLNSTAVQVTQLTDVVNGKINAGENNAGVVFTSMTVGIGGGVSSRAFDGIVVGTAGAIAVDAYVTSTEQFNLILGSFGARGLTTSATAQGTIYFRNGLYTMNGATIPAGINIVCGSSVNFILTNIANSIMNIYGQVGNGGFKCNMDAGGLAFNGRLVRLKSNSQVNLTMVGGQKQANLSGATSFVDLSTSSNAYGDLWFKEFTTCKGASAAGSEDVTFYIAWSSNSQYNIRTSSYIPNSGDVNQESFLGFSNNKNIRLKFDVAQAGLNFINILGKETRNNYFEGVIYSSGSFPLGSYGTITFDANSNDPVSTSPIHINLDFYITGGVVGWDIIKMPDITGISQGIFITGSARCSPPFNNTVNLIRVATTDYEGTVISGFRNQGCQTSLNDGGTGTVWEFFKDGVRSASW